MIKQTIVYLYNEIQYSNKREWNGYMHLDYAQMHYSKWKKPDSRACIWYDSTYMLFWERQNCKDVKQIIGRQGLDREVDHKKVWGDLFCLMELFYILIVMGVTLWYAFVRTHRTVHRRGVIVPHVNYTPPREMYLISSNYRFISTQVPFP